MASSRMRCVWAETEVVNLLNIIRNKYLAVIFNAKSKKKRWLFSRICDDLRVLGSDKNTEQVQLKIKNLKRRYRELLTERSKGDGYENFSELVHDNLLCEVFDQAPVRADADGFDSLEDPEECLPRANVQLLDPFDDFIERDESVALDAEEDGPSCSQKPEAKFSVDSNSGEPAAKRQKISFDIDATFPAEWMNAQESMLDSMFKRQEELLKRINKQNYEAMDQLLDNESKRTAKLVERALDFFTAKRKRDP